MIYQKIDELDRRLSIVEETFSQIIKSINELDELIAGITRTNKEILYRIQKAQLKDNKE